ncbi:MAG: hypothetical protein IKP86_13330, partial [Anaerolineaceae bacterium]|nr:hypothetical protein [Anaerolineaceae bacterium]
MEQKKGHLTPVTFRIFNVLSVLSGLTALFFTFAEPSEAKNARFGGYSLQRWLLGAVTLLLLAFFIRLLSRERKTGGKISRRLD